MAKTAKLKKKQAAPHSRAARRAASPSLPVGPIPPRAPSPTHPSTAKHHVLSASSAGVSKRKSPKMTRSQRVRAEKAMERAADDMDKWEKKKARSLEKARGIKERAKVWDDINEEGGRKKGAGLGVGLEEDGQGGDAVELKKGSVWGAVGDEDMDGLAVAVAEDGAAVESTEIPAVAPQAQTQTQMQAQTQESSTAPPVDEDELL